MIELPLSSILRLEIVSVHGGGRLTHRPSRDAVLSFQTEPSSTYPRIHSSGPPAAVAHDGEFGSRLGVAPRLRTPARSECPAKQDTHRSHEGDSPRAASGPVTVYAMVI